MQRCQFATYRFAMFAKHECGKMSFVLPRGIPLRGFFVLVFWAGGCGSGGNGADLRPRTLTREDVAALPPGSASGSVFAGTYLVREAQIEACACRAGTCQPFHALSGASSVVTQNDGALASTGSGLCTGGIDEDGRYWCGEAEQSATSTIFGREEGTFELIDGMPTWKKFTVETTAVMTLSGVVHDCDVRASGTAQYMGR